MMDAQVYQDGADFLISLTVAGVEVEVAGPFDDQLDAELAALRMAPRVELDYDGRSGWEGSGWNSFHRTPEERRAMRLARAS